MHPIASERIRMHPNVSECVQTGPNGSERVRTRLDTAKFCAKTLKILQKTSKKITKRDIYSEPPLAALLDALEPEKPGGPEVQVRAAQQSRALPLAAAAYREFISKRFHF